MQRSIISSKQFNRSKIQRLVHNSKQLILNEHQYSNALQDKILANVFFEPSTRTSTSFQAAMLRLGGKVIQFNPSISSTKKNESLIDTLRTLEQYTNVTVMRHPQANIFEELLPNLKNPLINGGDGENEHPTQALLDILTMQCELHVQNLDDLTITMVGDLKYGRTVHSLTKMLLNYENMTFNFVSPESLKMPEDITTLIDKSNSSYNVYTSYAHCIPSTDVLYMTRIQEERLQGESREVNYSLSITDLDDVAPHMIILHPLPRVNEIQSEVDLHHSAKYFDQVKYGMYMRMTLLCDVLNII